MWSLLVESLPQSRLSLRRLSLAKAAVAPLCAQTTGIVMAYRYAVLWNCNYLLRFRSSGFGSSLQFFNKILLFNVRSSVLFPRKLASHFLFSDFGVPFYVGSGFKPGSGTGNGMHYRTVQVPAPLTQKVAVPVPQNTAGTVCYVRLFVLIFNAFRGNLISF